MGTFGAKLSWLALLLPVLTMLLVAGCSTKVPILAEYPSRSPQYVLDGESLWVMQIQQGEKIKFEGLLALNVEADSADLVVLDSSGFILLEGELAVDQPMDVVNSLDLVERHGLPDYLSKTMQRVLFKWPSQSSCEKFIWSLCWADKGQLGMDKIDRFGPFTTWQVLYTLQKSNNQIKLIKYEIPLVGHTLFLKRIE